MTDMQRYGIYCTDWQFDVLPADDGLYVLASDAEAAIAAADQRGRESAYADYLHQKEPFAVWCMEQGERNQRAVFESLIDAAFAKGVWQGQQDMLTKCIALVEGTYTVSFVTLDADFQSAALVALRALQVKP
jgi:hypothetical protein